MSIHSASSRNSFGLALFLPPIREIAGRGKPGCNGAPPYTGVTLTADGAWVEAFAVGDR